MSILAETQNERDPPQRGDRAIHIIQGESQISGDPNVHFSTVLGSCIATCLYDPTLRIGGMNHFLLADSMNSVTGDMKYGVHAMECLINALLRAGAHREKLVAKVFGGAHVIASVSDIGRKNVEFIKGFLESEKIPCVSRSVGGDRGRRIKFWPTTGVAKQMLLSPSAVADLDRPAKRPAPAAPKAPAGDLELF